MGKRMGWPGFVKIRVLNTPAETGMGRLHVVTIWIRPLAGTGDERRELGALHELLREGGFGYEIWALAGEWHWTADNGEKSRAAYDRAAGSRWVSRRWQEASTSDGPRTKDEGQNADGEETDAMKPGERKEGGEMTTKDTKHTKKGTGPAADGSEAEIIRKADAGDWKWEVGQRVRVKDRDGYNFGGKIWERVIFRGRRVYRLEGPSFRLPTDKEIEWEEDELEPIPQHRAGTCQYCGCEDEHGCEEGCSWVDRKRTVCTSCVAEAETEAKAKGEGQRTKDKGRRTKEDKGQTPGETTDDADGADGEEGLATKNTKHTKGSGQDVRAPSRLTAILDGLAAETERVYLVPLDQIEAHPKNPRHINIAKPDKALLELAESIKAQGVKEPALGRPLPLPEGPGTKDKGQNKIQLVFGHRRWHGCRLAGAASLKMYVREMDDIEALELMSLENLQRENLTPLEEAAGIRNLTELGRTHGEIAAELGKPLSFVARRAALHRLDERWVRARQGEDKRLDVSGWGASHLELVASLPAEMQAKLYGDLSGSHWWGGGGPGGWSLGELSRFIGQALHLVKLAPWGVKAEELAGECACQVCSRRSGCQPELFESLAGEAAEDEERGNCNGEIVGKDDTCLDPKCWERKMAAWLERKAGELKEEHGDQVKLVRESYSPPSPAQAKANPLLAKTVYKGDLRAAKKGEAGAFPILQVEGAAAGQTQWMKAESYAANKPGLAAPKTLAQKRKELEGRRLIRSCEEVIGELERLMADNGKGIDLEKLPGGWFQRTIAVVVLRGCRAQGEQKICCAKNFPKDIEALAADVPRLDMALVARAMDTMLRELNDDVKYKLHEQAQKTAAAICWVWGWPWAAFLKRGEAAIPEPKAWAAQEKDKGQRTKDKVGKGAKDGRGKAGWRDGKAAAAGEREEDEEEGEEEEGEE